MENRKLASYYISKILEDIDFIMAQMSLVEEQNFGENPLLLDSMMFRLIQISENAKNINNDFKSQHESIPWFEMYGLRNRIVHDYGNVDLSIIYDTLVKDIPELKEALGRLML
ncbi:MAG: DUF86 domain-containing protein [Clostridiaceae bacterium]|jgi:uncharacterized protein with HEPN domain|nr:DUF86 domain-containing protein [Clostridiaceae bacterium]